MLKASVAEPEREETMTEAAIEKWTDTIKAAISYDAGRIEAERDLAGIVRLDGSDLLQLLESPITARCRGCAI